MRVGLIFECGPNGPDIQVCQHFIKKHMPKVTHPIYIGSTNKKDLINTCGLKAKSLFEIEKCDHVLIIWDLYPNWERGKKPCRWQDRQDIIESLNLAGVNLALIHLVCIEEELEDWLLIDGDALSRVLSTTTHKVTIPSRKKTGERNNPKTQLKQIFSKDGVKFHRYDDYLHAKIIAQHIKDLSVLVNNSQSFKRFMEKVLGQP